MKIKIVNKSQHPLPDYATALAAGMDLRANLTEPIELAPLERSLIPTGIYIQLPEGYEAQIRPRSGLAIKHGISIVNAPGTIDADYRRSEEHTSELQSRPHLVCRLLLEKKKKKNKKTK